MMRYRRQGKRDSAARANGRHRLIPHAHRWPGTLALAVVLAGALPLSAQDSIQVMAGPHYEATRLKRWLLGSGHRDLWLTPIRVPVLWPDTFAGGLSVLRRGPSEQTPNLRFENQQGRPYVFRSLDKEQAAGLPRDLQNTLVEYVVRDMVSAKHPGAAVVVASLLEAAGVLHATPRLAVMADDPTLGEHGEVFAGMLGMIEDHPNEVDSGRAFGGFDRIIGSERLLERLEESSEDRVDSRAYLAARLIDVLVDDWDRHGDQWRWGERRNGDTRIWVPIPRDRDNAFPSVDGVIGFIGSMLRPNAFRFDSRYTNLYGLLHNAQPLDRQILADLPVAVWDSVATELHDRLTDEAIDQAVRRLPAPWFATGGRLLAEKLRARRDSLPTAARELYGLLASEVDIYGTDEVDHAEVERLSSDRVRVRLSAPDRDGITYFERTFVPDETREVRIHLRGGADHAEVRGVGDAIAVRILGGGGDDVLEDLSETAARAVTALYDDRGENTLVGGSRTRIDRRAYEPPEPGFAMEENAPPPRDWGTLYIPFLPEARWYSELGPIIGGGPTWIRFGFRRVPYAARTHLRLLVAPWKGRAGVEASVRLLRTGGGGETRLDGRATQLAAWNFYGYGNETSAPEDAEFRRVFAAELAGRGDLVAELGKTTRVAFGSRLHLIDPEPRPGSPATAAGVLGGRSFGVAGVGVEARFDGRDSAVYPRKGFRLTLRADGYPLVWGDAADPFSSGAAVGSVYLPLPGRLEPVVALRAGAERLWGDAPFQFAPALGGATLRGYRSRRFTGDAAVFGSAELRATIGRANLLLLRGDLGALGLIDVGRVFVDGQQSDRWHTGYGGGLWFRTLEGHLSVYLQYAYGDRSTLRTGIGMPF